MSWDRLMWNRLSSTRYLASRTRMITIAPFSVLAPRWTRMAPKRTGLPKGAPLPRKTIEELMEEARIRADTNIGVTSKSRPTHAAAAVSSRWQGLAGKSQGSPMPLAPSGASTGIVKALGKVTTSTFTTRSQYRARLRKEKSKPQPISAVTLPPPSQLVPKRTDLPVVRNLTRGYKRKAIAVASDHCY